MIVEEVVNDDLFELQDNPYLPMKDFFKADSKEKKNLLNLVLVLLWNKQGRRVDFVELKTNYYFFFSNYRNCLLKNVPIDDLTNDLRVFIKSSYMNDIMNNSNCWIKPIELSYTNKNLNNYPDVYSLTMFFHNICNKFPLIRLLLNNVDFILENWTLHDLTFIINKQNFILSFEDLRKAKNIFSVFYENGWSIEDFYDKDYNSSIDRTFYTFKNKVKDLVDEDYKENNIAYSDVAVFEAMIDLYKFCDNNCNSAKELLDKIGSIHSLKNFLVIWNDKVQQLTEEFSDVPIEWLLNFLDKQIILNEFLEEEQFEKQS